MVTIGTGTAGTRFLNTNWPITEGLDAETNKLRKKAHLEPEEKNLISENDMVGL